MSDVSTLLARARRDPELDTLSAAAARGAEAYFQAYEYVANGNLRSRPMTLRGLASQYLAMTASPPLTESQREAASLARRITKRAGRKRKTSR
jgi:hypothetical protein